jgi:hypothetical protein
VKMENRREETNPTPGERGNPVKGREGQQGVVELLREAWTHFFDLDFFLAILTCWGGGEEAERSATTAETRWRC